MTQQEMETIIQELETTFNQKAVEKTWEPNSSGFDFDRYIHTWANDRTRQFETYYGVALWAGNVLVTTITKVDQWEAFKTVARLFCQREFAYDEKWEEDCKDPVKYWEMTQGTYKQS